jgi:hypothetical protein
MNITIEKLLDLKPELRVIAFMERHGTNHQKIVDYWGDNPEDDFTTDIETLLQCLAYAVQRDRPSSAVVMRLLGRARAIRQVQETKEVQEYMDTKMLLY